MQDDGNLIFYNMYGEIIWYEGTNNYESNVLGNAKKWLNPAVAYSETTRHNGYFATAAGYVAYSW